MLSLQTLPEEYEVKYTFDFKKVIWAVGMNIAGLVLAFLVGGFLTFLAGVLRSDGGSELALNWGGNAFSAFWGIVLMFAILVLHELIHGLGFWWFTRAKPVFGGNLLAAYAGAPGWYIPAHQHFIIGIAPLIVLTILGVGLMLIVPTSWIFAMIFLTALQAGGAIGDLLVCSFEIMQPKSALVHDDGLMITIYGMR